jgi:hypothetical protein
MNRGFARWRWVAGAAIFWWLITTAALAATSFTLPLSGKPTRNGISINVERIAPETPGYIPFRFTISASPPALADRTYQFEVSNLPGGNLRSVCHVEQEIVLPGGAASVQKVISIPCFVPIYQLAVTTWENGRQDKSLSVDSIVVSSTNLFWGSGWGTSCSTLFLEANPPLVKDFTTALYMGGVQFQPNVGARVVNGNPSIKLDNADASQFASMRTQYTGLPTRWIDYSTYGLICVSSQGAEKLAQVEPAAWNAIGDWVRSGGNLVVYDVPGTDADEKLRRILWEPKRNTADNSPAKAIWRRPSEFWLNNLPGRDSVDFENAAAFVEAAVKQSGYNYGTPNVNATPSTTNKDEGPKLAASEIAFRDLDLGRIVLLACDNPYAGKLPHLWNVTLQSLGTNRWDYQSRHGLSLDGSNADFWNFLIAGVGLAPVNLFRVLITLFVLGVGPANYYFLKRAKRLYLMLFTVPLIAFLVTTSLFAFGMFSDGFSSRMRIRGLSLLDQDAGKMTTTARLSYYAGLAPSSGLVLSNNVELVPLFEQHEAYESSARKNVTWTDKQQLHGGYLLSRTMLQYIATSVESTKARLEITQRDGTYTAVNYLDVPVSHFVAWDENKGQFEGMNIAANATARLIPAETTPGPISQEIGRILQSAQPQPPGTFNNSRAPRTSFQYRSRYFNGQPNSATTLNGSLETGFTLAISMLTNVAVSANENTGPIVDGAAPSEPLKGVNIDIRRKFFALVPATGLIDLGIQPDVVDPQSVHLLIGGW